MAAERIILIFYCTINIVQYLIVNISGTYIADALGEPMTASPLEQLLMLAACLAMCGLGYAFYRLMVWREIPPRLAHDRRIRQALIAGLVMMFLGYYFFDYGRAEFSSTLPFGFIFRVIPTDLLFSLYFCTIPLDRARSYILVVAYLAVKIAMGWTGMFSGVFWILFIRIVNQNSHRRHFVSGSLVVLLAAFVVGPLIYSIKFYLRWGEYDFTYVAALTRLVGRIGFYSNSLYIYENGSSFAADAAANLPALSYLKDALVAVLPRSLLGLQGENMETVFVDFVTGGFVPGITFYLGLLGKAIAYMNMSFYDMPLMLLTVAGLQVLIFRLSGKIIGRRANPILYLGVFQVLLSGSLEEISYSLYAMTLVYLICISRWSSRPHGDVRDRRALAAAE